MSGFTSHCSQARPGSFISAQVLDEQRFAVLATRQKNGQPYASLVAFWAAADLTRLTFCVLRTTCKFANLEADRRVALLIDNRDNEEIDLLEAAANTVFGTCREAEGEERVSLSERFLAKHPAMKDFVSSPSCAVMPMDALACLLVTRFQNVIELRVKEGRLDAVDSTAG